MPTRRETLARPIFTASFVLVAAVGASQPGCSTKEPEATTYFERSISPILVTSCVRTNTGAGCHVATEKGNALGNLDVATFAGVDKRRDLLADYGPYGQPAFLLKVVGDAEVQVESFDGVKVAMTTDIKHTGGSIFDATASGYASLRRWIDNGATENNTGQKPPSLERLPCSKELPPDATGFDASKEPTGADFATFRDRVNPIFGRTCAASNCHGVASNELYLTCGETPEQLRWNYHAAVGYLGKVPEQSELMRRPLAPAQGGSFHEGGVVFPTVGDDGYQAILDWAKEHGPAVVADESPAFLFFAHKVQPVLVKKGCMMLQCHSAAQFHDYRLRGGSGGAFSLSTTRRNYDLSLAQISIESADASASRILRKNIYRPEVFDGATGLAHRGGPLFEDFGNKLASGEACDAQTYDYDAGNPNEIPGYCIMREWIRRERDARRLAPLSAVVYVRRGLDGKGARPQDFDVYSPGADLRRAAVTAGAAGELRAGADASLTAGCGLDRATADIRRPTVSWDGGEIAFAARSSAAEPLQVYTMKADGSACAKHAGANAGENTSNGLLVHNFDPVYGPPDRSGVVTLVFASTRGNLVASSDYSGAQRTPADPAKPNANLYAVTLGAGAAVRQLTYLLNMERQPSFMSDGRLIMAAEKRAPGFYQIAGRRVNLDGGDYHPLFAQRGSIGYAQMADIVEMADKNFVGIFSDPGAPHGGGALGVVNRSLGIDFQSTNPKDYVIDSSVIDPAAPASPEPSFFLRSLRFPDATVSGRPAERTSGLYRSPAPLPSTKLLVSFGAADAVSSFAGDYDVYVFDTTTGQKTKLLGEAGAAEVDAVAVYGRASHGIFAAALAEPNGHTRVYPGSDEAVITYLDVPVMASLLFQNTPTGRPIEEGLTTFSIYEDMPPPLDVATFAAGGANVATDDFGQVYVRRRLLGQVPIAPDGSTRVRVPGGLPLLYKLPDTAVSREKKIPRVQRETVSFAPGEDVHQSFRRGFFNGLCGQCHGAVSGRAVDVAVQPDILTQASRVAARDAVPYNLALPPDKRGPVEGPPASP